MFLERKLSCNLYESKVEYEMLERNDISNKNKMLFWVVLSLIFWMPAAWRNSFATTCGQLFGYIVIGYLIIKGLNERRLEIPRSNAYLFGVVCFWIIISMFDSFRFYSEYGTLSGETTFTAPLGSIYFHLFYVALFVGYIGLVKDRTDVENTLHKGFNTIIWIQIIVGVIQLLIIFGVPGIGSVYDRINILGMMPTASFIKEMSRITMTGSEPATMGASVGMLSLPYLLAVLQSTNSDREKIACFLKLVALIVLSYFSKSTTLFAIIAVSAASFVIWSFRKGGISKRKTILWIVVILTCGILTVISSFGGKLHFDSGVFEEIRYYLLVKPTDSANMSTMHRLSPTVNDIEIIKKHSILGVGDGNQGFTYGQNVPSFMLINPKSKNFAKGIGGVVNGGAWFWAVFSGYGIVGLLALFIWYINNYRHKIKMLQNANDFLYGLYVFALPAVIITLLTGAMEPIIVFILSIPLWEPAQENQNREE